MKDTVRFNFDFPREHYLHLKMICAREGVSLKHFATELLIEKIEDDEDLRLAQTGIERLKEMSEKDYISFEEACDLAGWGDVKEV